MKLVKIFIVLFFFCIACKEEKKGTGDAVESDDNTYTVERVEGCESKESVCKRLKITYPNFSEYSPSLQGVIDDYMTVYLSDFLITDKPLTTKNFQDFITQSADAIIAEKSDNENNYNFFFDFRELFSNDQLLCVKSAYKVEEDDEKESGVGYTIFDQEANEVLQIPQIIQDEEAVRQILLKELKNQLGISESDNIEDQGFYVSDRDFAVTDNIGIKSESLLFAYLPLEIAPKQEGLLSITLAKSEVQQYLTPDFVKKWETQ